MCLATSCDGDARVALNALERTLHFMQGTGHTTLSLQDLTEAQKACPMKHTLSNRDTHYDLISALHKSIRGSDVNASLYYLGRMLQPGAAEDPLYIARRLIRIASEDIGLADDAALALAVATYDACHRLGLPECDVVLAHCVAYQAKAPKSVAVYRAWTQVRALLQPPHPQPPVPLHLRNAPTALMRSLGYGHAYQYPPDYPLADGTPLSQTYLPSSLTGTDFFSAGNFDT